MNYTIQPGDTLTSIARRFGSTIAEIARLNGINNPDRIRAGQSIDIPGLPEDAGSLPPPPVPGTPLPAGDKSGMTAARLPLNQPIPQGAAPGAGYQMPPPAGMPKSAPFPRPNPGAGTRQGQAAAPYPNPNPMGSAPLPRANPSDMGPVMPPIDPNNGAPVGYVPQGWRPIPPDPREGMPPGGTPSTVQASFPADLSQVPTNRLAALITEATPQQAQAIYAEIDRRRQMAELQGQQAQPGIMQAQADWRSFGTDMRIAPPAPPVDASIGEGEYLPAEYQLLGQLGNNMANAPRAITLLPQIGFRGGFRRTLGNLTGPGV